MIFLKSSGLALNQRIQAGNTWTTAVLHSVVFFVATQRHNLEEVTMELSYENLFDLRKNNTG